MSCLSGLMQDQDVVPVEDADACVAGCAADGILITSEFNDVMCCINTHPVCAEACAGVVIDGLPLE